MRVVRNSEYPFFIHLQILPSPSLNLLSSIHAIIVYLLDGPLLAFVTFLQIDNRERIERILALARSNEGGVSE